MYDAVSLLPQGDRDYVIASSGSLRTHQSHVILETAYCKLPTAQISIKAEVSIKRGHKKIGAGTLPAHPMPSPRREHERLMTPHTNLMRNRPQIPTLTSKNSVAASALMTLIKLEKTRKAPVA
jgi:hypothetical protein